MSTILIILPILTVLMFELGLELELKDFTLFWHRPRPVIAGLIGQIIVLPILAIILGTVFHLEPLFFIGLVLIACSPGGSSSNVFSMIAKGDVALSVSLTALSSIITLFTIPVIMAYVTTNVARYGVSEIHLPIGSLIVQNLIFSLLPILCGVFFKHKYQKRAEKIKPILNKIAFPALLFLATVFFIQHRNNIMNHIGQLGFCISALILLAMFAGVALSYLMRLRNKERRTIVIEIGMQNAAQGIAIATSPLVFNNEIIAIPSILYALFMNVILLIYIKTRKSII